MLISCVCPTRNRREWLPQAIACFFSQDWPEKELIIVADGTPVKDLIPYDPRINLIKIDNSWRDGGEIVPSIGWKRNLGAAYANGDFIVHLDDDDHSAPGRITDQVNRLESTDKSVTGYSHLKFTDGAKWWLYSGDRNWAFDTTLCYRRSFWMGHKFESINDGLEAGFRDAAIREGQFITADAGDLMHATIHDANTGPRIMTPGNLNWTEL
jgi:glycosyltransferase involved in cell wall biosynthesis